VGINSHGSAGNSHSHWGGFPFASHFVMHVSCLCSFLFDILSDWCCVAVWAASLMGIFCFSGSLPLCFAIVFVLFYVCLANKLSLSSLPFPSPIPCFIRIPMGFPFPCTSLLQTCAWVVSERVSEWQGRRSLWDRGDTSPQYLDWGDIITNVPTNISRVISATFYPWNIFLISWRSF